LWCDLQQLGDEASGPAGLPAASSRVSESQKGESYMSRGKFKLSLDGWAVGLALLLALLVRLNIFPKIPW
jgi:hypothetical protein